MTRNEVGLGRTSSSSRNSCHRTQALGSAQIPIPPGIFDEVCRIIRKKIEAGVYEPSNSSYRSRWFCVLKKDGKALRLVHSLEPLNAVTIQHSGVPPIPEHIAEKFGNRACGGMLDLYVGYDEREIAESSRDLTSFQTPYGALRLVTLPMGWTNAVPIFHDDVTYILQPEIPHITIPYIDDVPVRAQRHATNWQMEATKSSRQIRAFVDLSGSTCIASAGSYSACDTGWYVLWHEIPLIGSIYVNATSRTRESDTTTDSHITLNDRESRFSQPKLEIYGLFRALRALRLYLIGVRNLVIEVDARYIKGMLQNPDIAPSASINRWIVAILTFHFTLVHVPGTNHGPDGLSRRPRQPDDEDEPEDDFEDWIDRIHGFAHLVNPHPTQKVTRDSLVSIYTIDEPQPDCDTRRKYQKEKRVAGPPVDSYDIVPRSIQAIALDQSFYLFATGIELERPHNSQMQTTRLLLSSQYNSSSTLTDFGSAIHTEHTNLSSHPKDVSIFCEHVTMK
ncbi:hypothetical protein A0H81_06079 [Grifola frondosa]|uniref:Reverse transcriptase RNase H-like domain-containing protein n=1 Tax=Grifola frondosa TaxID=5627 RepID=A0A1C7MAH9_GRIFR|nr:hypothetical protein A0H81_06079 [Grifola frondosa]